MPDENTRSPEQRRFSRILFNAPATITADGVKHPCEVLDLSLRGVLLRTAAPLSLGATTELALTLGSDDFGIVMSCEVAHVTDAHIGLRCMQTDLDSITHLRRLLELNANDADLLERELSALIAQ